MKENRMPAFLSVVRPSQTFRGSNEPAPPASLSAPARMLTAVYQTLCIHDDMRTSEPGRLFLRCTKCGRETAGWTVKR